MKHHKTIQPPLALQWEILDSYDRSKQISLRGVTYTSPSPIEIGEIIKGSLKTIGLTGSVDFFGKVLKCDPIQGKTLFEVSINFYDMSSEKQDEVESFIDSIS